MTTSAAGVSNVQDREDQQKGWRAGPLTAFGQREGIPAVSRVYIRRMGAFNAHPFAACASRSRVTRLVGRIPVPRPMPFIKFVDAYTQLQPRKLPS